MRLDFRCLADEHRKAFFVHFYSFFSWYLRPTFLLFEAMIPNTTPYLVCT
jgi:hypothetical protein